MRPPGLVERFFRYDAKRVYPSTYDLTCSDVFIIAVVSTVMPHLKVFIRKGEKYATPRDVFSVLVGVCAGRMSASAFYE